MAQDQITIVSQEQQNIQKFSFYKALLNDCDAQKLLLFFIITLFFAFIEFFCGYFANSLSLMSDSVHMLFDSTALAIAVYAQIKSKAPADILHSFGLILLKAIYLIIKKRFERYKVLTGYINGIFLFFIAFYILIEAIDRIINPPKVKSFCCYQIFQIVPNLILIVAIIGFVINLIGLFFFHGHSGHSHSHSHSQQNEQVNTNIAAVFLHILADALGSIGVIISAILIKYFKFYRADSITSIVISCLIICSVLPLLKNSGKIMLQNYDIKYFEKLKQLLQMVANFISQQTLYQLLKLSNDTDIIEFSNVHLWSISSNKLIFTIKLIRNQEANEEQLLKRVQQYIANFQEIKEMTISIIQERKKKEEKESLMLELGMKIFESEISENY